MKLTIRSLKKVIREELNEFTRKNSSNKANWKPSKGSSFFGFGGGASGGGFGGGGWGMYGSYWPDWVESWGHNNLDTSDLPNFMQQNNDAESNANQGQFGSDIDSVVDSGDGDGVDGGISGNSGDGGGE